MPEANESPRDLVLEVSHLSTVFESERGGIPAVRDVSFTIKPGQTLGLVGKSGCGKTVTGLSVLRLINPPGRITAGKIFFRSNNLAALSESEMRRVRGRGIAMIFQEPKSSLNPLMKIGSQMIEGMRVHLGLSRAAAWTRGLELLEEVGFPEPSRPMNAYSHQLSGGMRQRALIAVALSCRPQLLIADEPTTSLDVTLQGRVLGLLHRLKKEHHLSILMISHDLGVIAQVADRVAVMHAGRTVEEGAVDEILLRAQHPATQELLVAAKDFYSDDPRAPRG